MCGLGIFVRVCTGVITGVIGGINMFLNILGTKFEVIRVSYSFYLIDSANNIALQPSEIYFIIV